MNTVFLNKQFNDNRFILCYRTLEDKDGILPMNRFDTVSNRFWYDPARFASFMNANLYAGKDIIQPCDLVSVDRRYDHYTRDVIMEQTTDKQEMYLAIENQLFDYGSAVRKVMYTTNAIEAVNSSFRKVTKKGAFPNETALFKFLYLRIKELEKKWSTGYIPNWSMVLNQLMVNDLFKDRIDQYIRL